MSDPVSEIRSALAAIEKKAGEGVEASAALGSRLEGVETKMGKLEAILARGALGGGHGSEGFVPPEAKEHRDLFLRWMRNPGSRSMRAELESMESKSADGLSDAAGGALVPELLYSQIISRVKQVSPMRQLVRVETIGSSDFKVIRSDVAASSGWVGETGTRSATDTPEFTPVSLPGGTLYAYVSATEEVLQDSMFNLEGHLVETIAREMAKAEGVAIISGNGSNKPRGLLHVTPESAEDGASPARTEGALRYIPTGVAGGFGSLDVGSPYFNPADVLVDTIYSLKAEHRVGASWVMNSATAGVIRKFRDADGRWLWMDGIAAGQPAQLLGFTVVIAEDWPDIAVNAFPVAFGNFRDAYFLGDRSSMRITVDDNITVPGTVKWYARVRRHGSVHNDEAVRVIKTGTS